MADHATTIQEDCIFFDTARSRPKKPKKVNGGINFAGNYWPPEQGHTLMYTDVRYAIGEARKLITVGYQRATAAIHGDPNAVELMTRWFGPRIDNPGIDQKDWWLGAQALIGAMDDFMSDDIEVYYRGDRSLIGKQNDYPNHVNNLIERDIEGYAESQANVRNRIIGLCESFFEKENITNSATIQLRGVNSVGGVLIHELSHNIVGTEDHYTWNNLKASCYGTKDCKKLAESRSSRAFYNADNIEYFCEDAVYNISSALPKPAVTTLASTNVANIRTGLGNIPMGQPGFQCTYQNWYTKTSRNIFHVRSNDLNHVDIAIRNYESAKNRQNLQILKTAFNKWYNANPAEVKARNNDGVVQQMKLFIDSVV
jgi:hypothetical protein